MRVLVCGGRTFSDREHLRGVLDRIHALTPITAVIHGAASGADAFAGEWAVSRNVIELRFPANWASDGRAAGPIRNKRMLREGRPDVVVAFPGGRGTGDMVLQAERANVRVIRPAAGQRQSDPLDP